MKHYKHPSQIKVALIGYGGVGGRRLAVAQASGMTPVSVVEPDAGRRAAAGREFPGVSTHASAEEMLKTSDANLVIIVTPHNLHAALTLQCLKAGRHVVCEKPLAIGTAECDAMIQAAKSRGLMLSVHHNRHWDGCILRAVEQVKRRKTIGDIVRIDTRMGTYGKPGDDWRSSRSISGGVAYDWGVHLLEFTLQLIDSEITEVSGYAHHGFWAGGMRWKADSNEDEAQVSVRFKSGQHSSLTVTQLDTNLKPGFLEITGTKGSYAMDAQEYALIRVRKGIRTVEKGPHPASQFHLFFENVAAHLTRGKPLAITPEWARRPVHILDLARKSAELGRALKPKYP